MTLIYVHYVPYVFSVESPAGPAAERVGGIRDAPAAPAPPLHRSAGLAPSQTGYRLVACRARVQRLPIKEKTAHGKPVA